MVEIQRILCPVDLSGLSRRSLDASMALARWYRAEITVLHVRTPDPAGPEADPRAELDRFAEAAVAEGVPTHVTMRAGNPVQEILAEAQEIDASLIVMGTHGCGGFERWVLGSVTDKVLRKASCPVLSIPHHPEAAPRPVKSVLCPVDFSATSLRALDFAASLAQEADARLTLLHVVEGLPDHEPRINVHFNVAEYRLYVLRGAKERLAQALPDEARAWCEPEIVVACGKPYREILRVCREIQADLLVLGVHGWGALDPRLFGSTAQHVVRESPCPVLTICPK